MENRRRERIADALKGKSPAPDRTIFWEWDEGGSKQLAAMHGNLKLVINSRNVPELYDVVADPAERMDRRQLYPAQVKELTEAVHAW